jgi:hypothetical protein
MEIFEQIKYNLEFELSICQEIKCEDCPARNKYFKHLTCDKSLEIWYNKQIKIKQWKSLNK